MEWITYDMTTKQQILRIANRMRHIGQTDYAKEFVRLANEGVFIQFCMDCGMTLEEALERRNEFK
jgi:hypothetical protein